MVSKAGDLSNEAIELENNHQYVKAAELYSEAVTILEQELLTSDQKQLIQVFITMYK